MKSRLYARLQEVHPTLIEITKKNLTNKKRALKALFLFLNSLVISVKVGWTSCKWTYNRLLIFHFLNFYNWSSHFLQNLNILNGLTSSYYFSFLIKASIEIHIVFKEVSYLRLIFIIKSSVFFYIIIFNLSYILFHTSESSEDKPFFKDEEITKTFFLDISSNFFETIFK